jgi:hypothetical protein
MRLLEWHRSRLLVLSAARRFDASAAACDAAAQDKREIAPKLTMTWALETVFHFMHPS